jgi:hypothetical protein
MAAAPAPEPPLAIKVMRLFAPTLGYESVPDAAQLPVHMVEVGDPGSSSKGASAGSGSLVSPAHLMLPEGFGCVQCICSAHSVLFPFPLQAMCLDKKGMELDMHTVGWL